MSHSTQTPARANPARYRVRYVLLDGSRSVSIPFDDEATADAVAVGLRRCPLVLRAHVEAAAEKTPMSPQAKRLRRTKGGA